MNRKQLLKRAQATLPAVLKKGSPPSPKEFSPAIGMASDAGSGTRCPPERA